MDYQTYENQLQEPYQYNPIDISIGFYALCSFQHNAWDFVFENIRKYYPNEPIVLINDGFDQYDYSDMAKKYNCIYVKKDRRLCLQFYTMDDIHEFLNRTKEACDLIRSEWMIQLHPDVICQGKISYYPTSDICGVGAGSNNGKSNNNWDKNDECQTIANYIRRFYPNLELNGWGWCGGSIMKISSFYEVYNNIYINKKISLEDLKNNVHNFIFKHEDTIMPVLFGLSGFNYRIWKDNPEYSNTKIPGAFLHRYKEHYDKHQFKQYIERSKNNNFI